MFGKKDDLRLVAATLVSGMSTNFPFYGDAERLKLTKIIADTYKMVLSELEKQENPE